MSDGGENQHPTLGLLNYKIDSVLMLLAEMRPDHDRLIRVEGVVTANTARLAAVEERVDRVDVSRRWEGRMEALAAAMVAVGAWFRP